MTFQELFRQADPSAALLITESGRYDGVALRGGAHAGKDDLPRAAAISFKDNADLVRALLHLDGKVERILLLSPLVETHICVSLLAKAEIDVVFGDRDDLEGTLPLQDLLLLQGAAQDLETAWLMATSGTTSEPKLVSHSLKSLTRTVSHKGAGADFIWGQLYDTYRFAGMQVLLQAVAGGSLLVAPSVTMELDQRLAMFAQEGVNAMSATPTLWRKILMSAAADQLSLRSITLGGEIADQQVLSSLASRYPAARIRHIYASTEAGTGFSVTDGKAGFPAAFLKEGFNGIGIKVIDDILYIENPLVSGKYFGAKDTYSDETHYVNTGDRVQIEGDRVFYLGRASGVINVGGDKVFPEKVEDVLNAVEGVFLSKVYGKKSPITGELVMAEIVLAEGHEKSAVNDRLMVASKEALQPYQRPFAYKFVETIAVSENGKVVRS